MLINGEEYIKTNSAKTWLSYGLRLPQKTYPSPKALLKDLAERLVVEMELFGECDLAYTLVLAGRYLKGTNYSLDGFAKELIPAIRETLAKSPFLANNNKIRAVKTNELNSIKNELSQIGKPDSKPSEKYLKDEFEYIDNTLASKNMVDYLTDKVVKMSGEHVSYRSIRPFFDNKSSNAPVINERKSSCLIL